jgi:hypothetical protein
VLHCPGLALPEPQMPLHRPAMPYDFTVESSASCAHRSGNRPEPRTSRLANTARAASAAVLMCSVSYLGSATATADPNPDVNNLFGSLSRGYTNSNCTSQPPPDLVLAFITCGQNPDTTGPSDARYYLFGNGNDLAATFKTTIGANVLANCGNTKSPTVWRTGTTTGNAGSVACGTDQGQAEVVWTTDAKNVLGVIHGPGNDVNALYQWWVNRG